MQPVINIGLSGSDRVEIAQGLAKLLADTYLLYIKTHNYHWNVTGVMFQTLHSMFEKQYIELADAVDLLAERMRALGHYAPGSYQAFSKLASIKESDNVPSATEMIAQLIKGHETVIETARTILPVVENAHDEATLELLTQRFQVHEKTAWMLRSLLQ